MLVLLLFGEILSFLDVIHKAFVAVTMDDISDVGRMDRLHHWIWGWIGAYISELTKDILSVRDIFK